MVAFATCLTQAANANLNHVDTMKKAESTILYAFPQGNRILSFTDKKVKSFWTKVKKTDNCWEWQGSPDSDGYGILSVACWPVKAHRFSYFIHYGDAAGLCVCHRCDNRKCVRPDHLFLGTNADNIHDMESKGRGVRLHGEKSLFAKLNEEQVREIRAMCCDLTISQPVIAKRFGISQALVSVIKNRKVWKNLAP